MQDLILYDLCDYSPFGQVKFEMYVAPIKWKHKLLISHVQSCTMWNVNIDIAFYAHGVAIARVSDSPGAKSATELEVALLCVCWHNFRKHHQLIRPFTSGPLGPVRRMQGWMCKQGSIEQLFLLHTVAQHTGTRICATLLLLLTPNLTLAFT